MLSVLVVAGVCMLAFFVSPAQAFTSQNILDKVEQKKVSLEERKENFASKAAAIGDAKGKAKELREKRLALREELKAKRQEIREKIKERREELKQKREELKEKRNEISQKRKEKIENFVSSVIEKQHAALERLNNIAERIQARLDKLKEKGADVTAAQTALDGCALSESSLQSGLESSVSVPEATGEDNNGNDEAMQAVTQGLKANRDKIIAYHKCLVGVIKLVKPLSSNGRGGTESAQ